MTCFSFSKFLYPTPKKKSRDQKKNSSFDEDKEGKETYNVTCSVKVDISVA